MGDLLVPAGPGRDREGQRRRHADERRGPASIDRYNRQRQISVNANIAGRAARAKCSPQRARRWTSCT